MMLWHVTVILKFSSGKCHSTFHFLKMGWVIGVEALQRGGGEIAQKEKVDEEEEEENINEEKQTTRKI